MTVDAHSSLAPVPEPVTMLLLGLDWSSLQDLGKDQGGHKWSQEMVKVDKEVKTEDTMTLKYLLQIDEPEKIEGAVKTGASFPDS